MELTDIEAALSAHESVTECAVVAVTGHDGLVLRLRAYVVPKGAAPDTAVWRAALRARFGAAVPPVSYTTLDRLPRGAGGKVDRAALPRAVPARPHHTPAQPVTQTMMG